MGNQKEMEASIAMESFGRRIGIYCMVLDDWVAVFNCLIPVPGLLGNLLQSGQRKADST